jgi:anti-sigma B factor antagonist
MKLSIAEKSPNAAVVGFTVENLDASNVKAFKQAIDPVLTGHHLVLLDMSGLKFVDSSGLGALLSCLRAMTNKDGELRLFGMTKPVRALFELVRMHRVFGIYASEQEALAAL